MSECLVYAEHHDYAFLANNSWLESVDHRLFKCILALPFRYNFFF